MPFLSYQISDEDAVRNAGRFLKEADMDCVKLEGGRRVITRIKAIVDAGILVIGHIGLTPQSSGPLGGFKAQGRDAASARDLIEDALEIEKAERCRQRIESVRKMAEAVGRTHSVLGWCEGPLALYADLRGVESMFMDLIDTPQMYLQAAETIIDNQIRFALAQVKAGADMIGVGDAVASLVSPKMYEQYVLPFEKRLFDAIHKAGAAVKLHICGDVTNSVGLMAKTGCDVIDLDWMVPLKESRAGGGGKFSRCGHIGTPAGRGQGPPQDVANAAAQCIREGGQRFIVQPGCEVPPGTPERNIRAFCPCDGCLIPDLLGLS
jgi:MtaA/CmuA family methyltransferase